MGIGDWGLGIGDWGIGAILNPQSPIPNPHFNYSIILSLIRLNKFINLKIININKNIILLSIIFPFFIKFQVLH